MCTVSSLVWFSFSVKWFTFISPRIISSVRGWYKYPNTSSSMSRNSSMFSDGALFIYPSIIFVDLNFISTAHISTFSSVRNCFRSIVWSFIYIYIYIYIYLYIFYSVPQTPSLMYLFEQQVAANLYPYTEKLLISCAFIVSLRHIKWGLRCFSKSMVLNSSFLLYKLLIFLW